MIWHIIAQENSEDGFSVDTGLSEITAHIDLSGIISKNGIRNNLAGVFDSFGAYPSETAVDLLKLGMTVYSADKSAKRDRAYNKWSRYFHLYQPVSNTDLWDGIKEQLEKTLNFLTGDHWEMHFRQAREKPLLSPKQSQGKFLPFTNQPKAVALLSGGLDSFVGAIDLLDTAREGVVFVSHYSSSGVTRPVQSRLGELLNRYYPNGFCHLQFFVQPAEGITGEPEPSQRSRSFLFLSLGAAVADACNSPMPLYVYENGLLSLNVPLAANRGGGLSTRTTHPYFLSMYQKILDSLGVGASISTPFRFLTKGEMLLAAKNQRALQEGIIITHSCSHVTYVRFKGGSLNNHCGYCFPCIVRRAATSHAGFDDVHYVVDVLKDDLPANRVEGKDLYAVKIALRRLDTMSSSLLSHIRTAGPLPGTADEVAQYVDVYKRGMAELKEFLG